jgi:hypothetical protein
MSDSPELGVGKTFNLSKPASSLPNCGTKSHCAANSSGKVSSAVSNDATAEAGEDSPLFPPRRISKTAKHATRILKNALRKAKPQT